MQVTHASIIQTKRLLYIRCCCSEQRSVDKMVMSFCLRLAAWHLVQGDREEELSYLQATRMDECCPLRRKGKQASYQGPALSRWDPVGSTPASKEVRNSREQYGHYNSRQCKQQLESMCTIHPGLDCDERCGVCELEQLEHLMI